MAVVPAFNILRVGIKYVVAVLALPGCTKMPRACLGVEGAPCAFAKGGGPTQPQRGHLRCSWCDPGSLQRCCGSAGGRARLKQLLRNMTPESKLVALQRLPAEPYAEHFESEFGARAVADAPAAPIVEEEVDPPPADEGAALEKDLGDYMDELAAAESEHGFEEVAEDLGLCVETVSDILPYNMYVYIFIYLSIQKKRVYIYIYVPTYIVYPLPLSLYIFPLSMDLSILFFYIFISGRIPVNPRRHVFYVFLHHSIS